MSLQNSVLIVEDHPVFLKGLTNLLESEPGFTVIGGASNCGEALVFVEKKSPNIVLVDLTLGNESGLDLIKEIRLCSPGTKVLVLSMHDERFYAERSLAAGALGYCMKEEAVDHIIAAVKSVVSGKTWLSPRLREQALSPKPEDSPVLLIHKLSNREFQIFDLIGKGLGTDDIAKKLSLSVKTIDTHKENIKVKLRCQTSKELRQYAIEWKSIQA